MKNPTIKELRDFLKNAKPCDVCLSPCIIHSTSEGTLHAEGMGDVIPMLLDEIEKLREVFEEIVSWCPEPNKDRHCQIAECEIARKALAESLQRVP